MKNFDFKIFFTKYKYIIIGVIILIILLIVIFSLRKKKYTNIPLPIDMIGEDNKNLTEEEAKLVRDITLGLYNRLKGIDWGALWGGKETYEFTQLLKLSDRLFVAVYNDFNNLYFKEGYGTLKNWIDDEYYFMSFQANALKRTIISRMNKLNLQ